MKRKSHRLPLVFFFLLSLALTGWTIANSLPVPKKSFNPLPYLATKSPYPLVTATTTNLGFEQCQPIHINHIGRHGSRHLSKTIKDELIAIITDAHQQNQLQPLAYKLLTMLNAVQNIEQPSVIGQLTEQGRMELRDIGTRLITAFPEPFTEDKEIMLQSTHVQRAKDSMQAFLSGLVAINPKLATRAQVKSGDREHCDPRLRFFEGCDAYSDFLGDHASKESFQKTWLSQAEPLISRMMKRIFKPSFLERIDESLRLLIAQNLFNLCQLQVDVDRDATQNGFCSFFTTPQELELFNWREDAGHYFSKADASKNPVTYELAGPLLKDFLTTTEKAITDKNAPAAHFRFAHAETIIPFYVLLGLYDDDSLNVILHHPERRRFRTAAISPMAANVQWILYRCPKDSYVVRMRHNEKDRAFPIAGCTKEGCPFLKVKRFYEQSGRSLSEHEWATKLCKTTSCMLTPNISDRLSP